jgi:hypothetical protein
VTSQPRSPAGTSDAVAAALPYFVLSMGYLVVLLSLGIAYVAWSPARQAIPATLGPIPVGVPWWGALGAVTISLYGVFFHNQKWERSFNYWHIARPFLGAVLGMVAYLVFVVVIDATGVQAKRSGTLVYYLVAFLVGYSEDAVQLLLKRATDVLFASGAPRSNIAASTAQGIPTHESIEARGRDSGASRAP